MDISVTTFAQSVKITDCRILDTPKLILLCGGVIAKDAEPYKSVRDYFYRYLLTHHEGIAKRVKLAETINDWFDHDTFSDLLELEEYLADLSDLIILFVESAGSIAELGAFTTSKLLRPKTLAVINSIHPDNRTFIADGPLRRLASVGKDLVRYYEWDPDELNDPDTLETLDDLSADLAQLLIDRETTGPKEQKINPDSDAHAMLLAADLVELVGITIETELLDGLRAFGYDVGRNKLRKYINLLNHLRIIKTIRNSTQTYYVSRRESPYIRYTLTSDVTIRDRDRIKTLIRARLKEQNDRRAKIYENYLRRMSKLAQSHVRPTK